MPELPEVQTVVDTLRPRALGHRFVVLTHLRADVVKPKDFDLAAALIGRSIVDVVRRAKRIVVSLDDGNRFYVHLGMTGRLLLAAPTDEIAKHTHLIADLDDGSQLRFIDARRFGGIFWLGTADHARLGPEPLVVTPHRLAKQLATTTRSIKTALLDQAVIAGVGNIYVDEALHRAGLHPLVRACDLDAEAVRRLSAALKSVLRRAIKRGGSSIRDYVDSTGRAGSFQLSHRVYDRAGDPCRGCKSIIVRVIVGGRSTHFCPTCQTRENG